MVCCALLVGLLWGQPARAESNRHHPIVHRVQPGQTLGMISKRWNVPVGVLCDANGIQRKKAIVPGQQLIVPALADKDGKAAKDLLKRGFLDSERRAALLRELEPKAKPAPKSKAKDRDQQAKAEGGKPDTKRSAKRDKSGRDAKAKASEKRDDAATAKLDRPTKKERGAKRSARSQRRAKVAQSKAAAKRGGYVRLSSLMGQWEGYALDRKGNPTPEAEAGFRKVLRSWRTGASAEIDKRLIKMVAQVSDHFAGKRILVVSGYRPKRKLQATAHSRHNAGEAMDFRIEGVENAELRDYARKFSRAGVGFYPNSSFVHLDARDYTTYWIDYSGPGEKPRYAHQGYTGRAPAGSAKAADAEPAAATDKAADSAEPTPPPPSNKTADSEAVARSDG